MRDNHNIFEKSREIFINFTFSKSKNKILVMMLTIFVLVTMSATVSADLVLDNLQFDPPIITAGDEVDIVVEYHDQPTSNTQEYQGNPEYEFRVKLEPKDTVTKEYVT